jgi:VWFA-related protein
MFWKHIPSALESAPSAHTVKRLCVSIAVSATLGLPVLAQTPAPSGEAPANASSPQFHVNPDEISIDLVAHDKKNRPLLNLTPADIAASDAGAAVQLSGLHLVTPQTGGAATIDLLFDRMTPESAKVVRDFADRLLSMAPDRTSFAVLGLDGGLRLFQNFTQDRAAIQTAANLALDGLPHRDLTEAEKQINSIARTGTLPSGANASVDDRARARMMLSALEESQRTVQDQHVLAALAGLQALVKAEQNLVGRKMIVFFSGGLRANSNTESMAREVVEAANRAGIAIYAIDANAVDTKSLALFTFMNVPSGTAAPRLTPGVSGNFLNANAQQLGAMVGLTQDAYTPDSMSNLEADRRKAEGNTLAFLANGTGGFAISAGDNPREPLQRLIGDIDTYYEASYTPALKDYDGQFHSIDIKPLRDGVTLRSRAGYFALPPEAAGSFSVRPFEAPLLKILGDSSLPDGVSFEQTVVRLGGNANRAANELAIEVPVSQLELHQDQRTLLYSAHLSILAQIRDKSGVVVERFSQDIARSGALETIEAARAGVVTLQRPFTAAPGDYVLEAAVFDRLGEKAGAQRTEFNIPAPPDAPWLSDIALVRHTEPLAGAPDPLEPMQYGKARVVPNLAQHVPAGTSSISFFFRIHPGAKLAGAEDKTEGKLDVDVQQNGKSLSHSSMEIAHNAGSDSSVNLATIQAGALSPGSYRAVFTYTQGNRSASRDLAFTIDASRAADGPNQPADNSASADTAAPADSGAAAPAVDLLELDPGRFTSASSLDSSSPGQSFRDSLIASARERALGYVDSLMNFRCIEVTDRLVDLKGTGDWTRHDKIAEMVTYENHEESRKVLEVNGQPGGEQSFDMKGARLEGEYGGVLKIVFDPASKAEFKWKETGSLDGAAVQVFSYRVEEKNSRYTVTALPKEPRLVGFHGLVYIDDATRGVRRITMEADGIPANYPVHASAIAIDYDYVAINNHDYLMPVRGEMRMKLGKLEAIQHRIEFRDYHRFGSDARIVGFTPK